jgi:shikimate dehydrogenase
MKQDWAADVRLGVVGHPVAHSRSPHIHGLFGEQFDLAVEYPLFDVLPEDFASFIKHREEAHQTGLNVTLPHKQAAHALCEVLTDRAWQAGAVNTLWWEGRVLHGDNTDGIGLVRDLTLHLGVVLKGLRVMVVGAGGACRGILGPLLEAGVGSVCISNRTVERAQALARVFAEKAELDWCALDQHHDQGVDLLINATSCGHAGRFPDLHNSVLGKDTICYDLSYGPAATPFLEWSRQGRARLVVDGLGMLVEQAAESFHRWTGCKPDTAAVLAAMRERGLQA